MTTRIDSYEDLTDDIVRWLSDYYWMHNLKCFVVGVSGGIDSAVVSTLCAKTGLPTYVVCMPLDSTHANSRLSEDHAKKLADEYENVTNLMFEFLLHMIISIMLLSGGLNQGTWMQQRGKNLLVMN